MRSDFLLEPFTNTIYGVFNFTWPMVIISVVVMISLRVSYLIKNRKHFVLYKELLSLSFIIYIMCLFQVVTFQDSVSWSSNNFIPFKEILRYNMGSRLFFKNVVGNMLMFLPYGFFVSYILDSRKINLPLFLTVITSVSIEIVQMLIGRVFDVDDIILNVIGGCLGFLLYHLLQSIVERLPNVFKKDWFLNILSIVILVIIVVIILM